MRTPSGTFATHIAQSSYTIARIWTLTAGDGTILRFTDHDRDLVRGADTFSSRIGFTASALLVALGSGIQGLAVEMGVQAGGITYDALKTRKWARAQCQIELVNWEDPDAGSMLLFGGEVTGIEHDEDIGRLKLEIKGKSGKQRLLTIEYHSVHCRADLGDARCKVDIDALKDTFTVATVASQSEFTTDLTNADDFWNLGVLRFTSGLNNQIAMEVRKSLLAAGRLHLMLPLPFVVAPGDTAEIWPGCDKQFSTCWGRYNNAVNFRGEPFIPAPEQAMPEASSG